MFILYLFVIALFYFFAILQNSFLIHFSMLGSVPNLVLILFFLLIFFEEKDNYFIPIFYAIGAGLILDLFFSIYFGVSMFIFLIIVFMIKIARKTLQERDNNFPFIYFLPLFTISLIIYNSLQRLFISNFNFAKVLLIFNQGLIFEIIYNLIVVSIAFYFFKKLLKLNEGKLRSIFFPK